MPRTKRQAGFTLSPEAAEILEGQANKSRFVSEAIISHATRPDITTYTDLLQASRAIAERLEALGNEQSS